MPFNPISTNLLIIDEEIEFSRSITYTDAFNISWPVVITTNQPNSTVNILGNTISGFYSDSFTNFVRYRTIQDTFVEVNKFEEVNEDELYGLYHYQADLSRYITYAYIATAGNGDTQTYTITVTNNWTPGRNKLLQFFEVPIQPIDWINNAESIIPWINNINQPVTWINN